MVEKDLQYLEYDSPLMWNLIVSKLMLQQEVETGVYKSHACVMLTQRSLSSTKHPLKMNARCWLRSFLHLAVSRAAELRVVGRASRTTQYYDTTGDYIYVKEH